nr:hypothetical protein [uncultured Sphaerochaeta sp.]
MEKAELQKQFEDEQDRETVAEFSHGKIYLPAYGEWCERKVLKLMDKAEAYDRLMSGRATPKELANILQAYVACNDNGRWSYFWTRPHAGKTEWYVGDYQGVLRGIALLDLPPCSCHWTDSLIVPDGWEEK